MPTTDPILGPDGGLFLTEVALRETEAQLPADTRAAMAASSSSRGVSSFAAAVGGSSPTTLAALEELRSKVAALRTDLHSGEEDKGAAGEETGRHVASFLRVETHVACLSANIVHHTPNPRGCHAGR